MKTLQLLLLSCVALATNSFSQTAGQFEFRKYNSGGGMTSFWITPENSKAFGLNGSGVPAMIAVGGSSTLAGLSDVAISGLADLDLLQYNAGTGKYSNIPGSTYLTLTAGNAAYQPLSSTLTTLSSATAAGLALMDDASATAQRTTLGLGTISTQAASSVSITGGSMSGMTISARSLTVIPQVGSEPKITFTSLNSGGSAILEFPGGGNSPTYQLRSQATGGTLISTGDTGTVTSTMLSNSGVTAASYTAANITVDAAGRITAASNGSAGIGGTVGTADNAIVRADGTGGSTAQGSSASIDDSGNLIIGSINAVGTRSDTGQVTFAHSGGGNAFLSPVAAGPTGLSLASGVGLGWSNDGGLAAGTITTAMFQDAANTIQLGVDTAANSATATAQTIKGPDATGTTSTGGKLTLKGGAGTSANGAVQIGSAATITDAGAPTFFDKVTLAKTGTSTTGGLEVFADPLNPGNDSLYILPPSTSNRIYIGKTGQLVGAINYQGASNENFGNIISTAGHYQIIEYGATGISILPFNGPLNLSPAVASGVKVVDTFIEVNEMTEPSAPAANKARFFLEDNGSGKSRLMVRFPSGASQQIAIEP